MFVIYVGAQRKLPGPGWGLWCLESRAFSLQFVSDFPLSLLLCVYTEHGCHARGHIVEPQLSPFNLQRGRRVRNQPL